MCRPGSLGFSHGGNSLDVKRKVGKLRPGRQFWRGSWHQAEFFLARVISHGFVGRQVLGKILTDRLAANAKLRDGALVDLAIQKKPALHVHEPNFAAKKWLFHRLSFGP